MATIDLATKFAPYVDEQFKSESKRNLLTNQDYDWTGAHSIKIYKISTSEMNDYDRAGTNTETNWSRFGAVAGLDATTEEMPSQKTARLPLRSINSILTKQRSSLQPQQPCLDRTEKLSSQRLTHTFIMSW